MDFTGLQIGVPKQVILNKGQVYQVLGANTGSDANGNGGTASTGYQLTGTTVRSVTNGNNNIKPITVFPGSSRTANPAACGSGGGDNNIVQCVPVEDWGTEYLTAPTSSSVKAAIPMINSYKVVVDDSTTLVYRNGVQLTGLIAGRYYYYESNTADHIIADKPVMVAQYITGGAACLGGGPDGDPEMMYLSPVNQAVKKAGIYRNDEEGIDENYLTIIVPTAGLSSLIISGTSTTPLDTIYAHPNKAGFSVAVKRWEPAMGAQEVITCDSAFTGITYGLGSVESYGYNVGFKTGSYITRTIYHFTGTGDWNNSSNWLNGLVAPLVIKPGEEVLIDPAGLGECNYTGNITVKPGGKLIVKQGRKLNVTGEVIMED